MLHTVIDHLVMPRARDFASDLTKARSRALRAGTLRIDDISKQAIYTSTLQLKGYFSLLQDVAEMYTLVDRDYIKKGVELCYELSKATENSGLVSQLQGRLTTYTENASKEVKYLVPKEQQEILSTPRARSRRAKEETQKTMADLDKFGITIDPSATAAIEASVRQQKEENQRLLDDVSQKAANLIYPPENIVDFSQL